MGAESKGKVMAKKDQGEKNKGGRPQSEIIAQPDDQEAITADVGRPTDYETIN